MELFCKSLPKLELHAHLNGSLSMRTLRELQGIRKDAYGEEPTCKNLEIVIEHGDNRTLDECFQLFNIAHELTSTPEAIRKATKRVIQEFSEDGVVYLELRSTPRAVEGVMTKDQYLQEMIEAVLDSETKIISTKILVSIDRRKGLICAGENVDLAIKFKEKYPNILVGIDLSGHPGHGDFLDFLPLLHKVRSHCLKLSIHCAEVPNPDEVGKILEFKPDRLGHCTCIHNTSGGSDALWEKLKELKIPVELCLTSNVKTKTVDSYKTHHFGHFIAENHPIVLSTDDKGVFSTNLSEEYMHACEHFHLSKEHMFNLCFESINYIFGTDKEKNSLKDRLLEWKRKIGDI